MNPAAEILAALVRRGESLATAESLTGGLVGSMLTTVPGSSAGYLGGVISYATRLKSTLAGVDAATLAAVGPVAEESARQMAAGVARICASTGGWPPRVWPVLIRRTGIRSVRCTSRSRTGEPNGLGSSDSM